MGAAIGSFLNVVIYRLPRGLSIYEPKHSFCPTCKTRLTALDLIPLLSWAFLGGKCRHCKSKVSSRYFIVELINASLWAGLWYQLFVVQSDPLLANHLTNGEATAYFVAYALFASALVAAIFTDLAHYIIPDQVNAFMLVVGLGLNIALIAQGSPDAWIWGIPSSIAGALIGWGVLWGIAFLGRLAFQKDAMGHGDIKMARGIGAVLLPASALLSFGVAIVLGAVIGILVIIARKKKPGSREAVEFYTENDKELTRALREARVAMMRGDTRAANQALTKAESRLKSMVSSPSGASVKKINHSVENLAKLRSLLAAGKKPEMFLSDDPGDVRLSGDLSHWLMGKLTVFEEAMKAGDIATAESVFKVLSIGKVRIHGADQAAIASANRVLDSVGLTLEPTEKIEDASILVVDDPELKMASQGMAVKLDGGSTLVQAALMVVGVHAPETRLDPGSGAIKASAVSGVRARVTTAVSIREGCKEILENGEAPDFLFVEPIGSLLKCGLGYLLAFDAIGLAATKFYESWFGENPYAVEDIEGDPGVELTMIPFGPYLAAGALVALFANDWLLSLWDAYLKRVGL